MLTVDALLGPPAETPATCVAPAGMVRKAVSPARTVNPVDCVTDSGRVPSFTVTWVGPRLAIRTQASEAGVPGRAMTEEANPNEPPTAASTEKEGWGVEGI